jgi:uncharacterized protein YbaA (DUF1428 family)
MKKSAHQVLKEAKEQNLNDLEIKELLKKEGIIVSIESFYDKVFITEIGDFDYTIKKFNRENVRITWLETHSTFYSIKDALSYLTNGKWILK